MTLMVKSQIETQPNTQVNVEVTKKVMDKGVETIVDSALFVGLILLGILGTKIKLYLERIETMLNRGHSKRMEDGDIETINNFLYKLLFVYKAVRVFILEFHNGKTTGNGKSYEKVSMTYEVAEVGYKKMASLIQNIPKSIIIEDLVRLKQEGVIVLKQTDDTSPLLIEGNDVVVLTLLNLNDVESGVIGMSFRERDFEIVNVRELEVIKNKIRQLLE